MSGVTVSIDRIVVPKRLRKADEAWVGALASNIADQGLHQPITVRRLADESGLDQPDRFILIAGAHRLAAVRSLGRETITAEVVDVDDRTARLIEIDENLFRRELSALDRAKFLAERKALYEEMHPETKRGVAGGKARQGQQLSVLSFAEDTAARIGFSARTIQRHVALWDGLHERVRDMLELHPVANNAAALRQLAALGEVKQLAAASRLFGGTSRTVAEAIAYVQPKAARPGPVAEDNTAGKLIDAWRRTGRRGKLQFLRNLVGADIIADFDADRVEKARL